MTKWFHKEEMRIKHKSYLKRGIKPMIMSKPSIKAKAITSAVDAIEKAIIFLRSPWACHNVRIR